MTELFELLLWQFYMISFFFVIGLLAQLIDMGAGAYIHRKEFDWKKLIGGLKWIAILYVLVLGIVEIFSVWQFGAKLFNIVYVDEETFKLLSAVSVVVFISGWSITKLKDALIKLMQEFGYKPTETEVGQVVDLDGQG